MFVINLLTGQSVSVPAVLPSVAELTFSNGDKTQQAAVLDSNGNPITVQLNDNVWRQASNGAILVFADKQLVVGVPQ